MPSLTQDEEWGRFTIRSAKFDAQFRAVALLDGKGASETIAAQTREAAVALVKSQVQEQRSREREAWDTDGIPPPASYRQAFEKLGPLPDGHRKMLEAHYSAPNHNITATRLAEAAGYANWNAANLQYGTLAFQVAEELGFEPPKRQDGTEIWTMTIATGRLDLNDDMLSESMKRPLEHQHFEWTLRPQVVEALSALGYGQRMVGSRKA